LLSKPTFGVEHEQFALVGNGERVDLDLRGVGAEEGAVELSRDLLRLLGEVAGQAERLGDGAAVMRHEAGRGIDVEAVDLLRRVMRDRLDVHAALGRGDEGDAARFPVDEQGEVEFLGDIDAVGHVEPVHLLAGRAGLDGDERVAEHLGRSRPDLIGAAGKADAALGVGAQLLELALAAAAGMDLRFHDVERAGQLSRGGDSLVDAHRGIAGGDGHAELRQQLLGLIFVDVHGAGLKHMPPLPAREAGP